MEPDLSHRYLHLFSHIFKSFSLQTGEIIRLAIEQTTLLHCTEDCRAKAGADAPFLSIPEISTTCLTLLNAVPFSVRIFFIEFEKGNRFNQAEVKRARRAATRVAYFKLMCNRLIRITCPRSVVGQKARNSCCRH